jgi:threonine dehydrogenase-like Zn-dependent dehydrogenase
VSSSDPTGGREVVVLRRGELVVRDAPTPRPEPGEAMVRVVHGGICGSDLHYWTHGSAGESVLREPLRLGHEIVGVVERAAADGTGPSAGAMVAVHPATNGSYLGSAAHLPHTQGGFASILALPAGLLRTVPDGVGALTAVLAEPAAVALHAVRRAGGMRERGLRGSHVAVIGCGPIGLLVVAAAIRDGAEAVTAVDLHAAPLGRARRIGAVRTLRPAEFDPPDDVGAASGAEPDITIECSGTAGGLAAAVRRTRRGGRVVMLGLLPPGAQPVPVSLAIVRELELVGSFRFTDEIDEVLAAFGDGSLSTETIDAVISHRFPAGDAHEAFRVAADAATSGKVVLDFTS